MNEDGAHYADWRRFSLTRSRQEEQVEEEQRQRQIEQHELGLKYYLG